MLLQTTSCAILAGKTPVKAAHMSGSRHKRVPPVTMSGTGPSREMTQFDLVVMVASLGGLGAVSSLLTELPAAFAVLLLVVPHGRRSEQPDACPACCNGARRCLSGRRAWATVGAFSPRIPLPPAPTACLPVPSPPGASISCCRCTASPPLWWP